MQAPVHFCTDGSRARRPRRGAPARRVARRRAAARAAALAALEHAHAALLAKLRDEGVGERTRLLSHLVARSRSAASVAVAPAPRVLLERSSVCSTRRHGARCRDGAGRRDCGRGRSRGGACFGRAAVGGCCARLRRRGAAVRIIGSPQVTATCPALRRLRSERALYELEAAIEGRRRAELRRIGRADDLGPRRVVPRDDRRAHARHGRPRGVVRRGARARARPSPSTRSASRAHELAHTADGLRRLRPELARRDPAATARGAVEERGMCRCLTTARRRVRRHECARTSCLRPCGSTAAAASSRDQRASAGGAQVRAVTVAAPRPARARARRDLQHGPSRSAEPRWVIRRRSRSTRRRRRVGRRRRRRASCSRGERGGGRRRAPHRVRRRQRRASSRRARRSAPARRRRRSAGSLWPLSRRARQSPAAVAVSKAAARASSRELIARRRIRARRARLRAPRRRPRRGVDEPRACVRARRRGSDVDARRAQWTRGRLASGIAAEGGVDHRSAARGRRTPRCSLAPARAARAEASGLRGCAESKGAAALPCARAEPARARARAAFRDADAASGPARARTRRAAPSLAARRARRRRGRRLAATCSRSLPRPTRPRRQRRRRRARARGARGGRARRRARARARGLAEPRRVHDGAGARRARTGRPRRARRSVAAAARAAAAPRARLRGRGAREPARRRLQRARRRVDGGDGAPLPRLPPPRRQAVAVPRGGGHALPRVRARLPQAAPRRTRSPGRRTTRCTR